MACYMSPLLAYCGSDSLESSVLLNMPEYKSKQYQTHGPERTALLCLYASHKTETRDARKMEQEITRVRRHE